jgi:hypothetical protein
VFESTEDDRVHTYLAYATGTTPKGKRGTGIHDRKVALGWITHRKDDKLFELVNKNTTLDRSCWDMGATTKENKAHQIGGHGIPSAVKANPGEGMKVGIIGLLRHGAKVFYYTSKQIWEWRFAYGQYNHRLLCVRASDAKPRKAVKDPTIKHEVIREARRNSKKDLTVVVLGINEDDIIISDYLFLHKPARESEHSTNIGSLLTSEQHRGKIFVKGIFVEERTRGDPPPLYYGVNFSKAALDRDRRSMMTGNAVATSLSEMWDRVISEGRPGMVKKYLHLLLSNDPDGYLEILTAARSIRPITAGLLHMELQRKYPDRFFYCAEHPNATEVCLSFY